MPFHVLTVHDAALGRLHRCAAEGNVSAVRAALVAGDDPHALDAVMGASPLHYAAQSGSADAVSLLLDHGALPNLQAQSHGMTPLMVAVWHRNPDVVARLLEDARIDVDVRARTGARAEDLIGGGFAPNAADEIIRTHFAHWRAARPALSLIAVLEDASLSATDKAARLRARLSAGADPNETAGFSNRNNPGHTPLLVASREGYAEIVSDLLDAGADMTLVDRFMLAHPAHKAAYMGHADVLRRLVAHRDFPKIANMQGPFNGYTALHDAAWHGHGTAAEVLLEAGVRCDLRGYDGRTAAELARAGGYPALAERIAARAG